MLNLLSDLMPPAYAQFTINVPDNIPKDPNVLKNGIIPGMIQLLLLVSFILSFVFLLLGGISWINSGGSKEGIEGARKRITYAILGLVFTLLSFMIVYTLGKAFGVNFQTVPLP